MVIKYINSLLKELEEEKNSYKEDNSKYNVTNCKKQLFHLQAIKRMLEKDEIGMKEDILKRLEVLEEELTLAIMKGNTYKVQSLKAEKSQLNKLLEML